MSAKKRGGDDSPNAGHRKKQKTASSSKGENLPLARKPSLLVQEIDFPRGGGTTLTPYEYKTVKAEATKEVADELFKSSQAPEKLEKKSKRKKSTSNQSKVDHSTQSKEQDTFRVEHLNYKRLTIGMKLLGQITAITPLALLVSLPNQLMGHIPYTHISSALTQRLETLDEELSSPPSDDESEADSANENEPGRSSKKSKNSIPELSEMFKAGQFVRCVVTELLPQGASGGVSFGKGRDDPDRKAARRVELSIRPDHVNAEVKKSDVCKGFTLSGSVKSIEDHGYIVDLGIDAMSGFLSFKHAKKGQLFSPGMLSVGAVLSCSVTKVSDNGRICDLSIEGITVSTSCMTEATAITSLLPGSLVQSLITAVLPTGLNVQILGFFEGTIDLFHIPTQDVESKYKIGQKIRARIIYNVLSSTPHRFALSLLPHVINLTVPTTIPAQSGSKTSPLSIQDSFPKGTIVENVKLTRVESEWGVTCEVTEGVQGFVHISNLSDDHVASISATTGHWKVGTVHAARVIGFSALDGLLLLTFRKSILEEKILKVDDVQVGQRLKGKVKALKDSCLVVALSGSVDAVVWPLHYSDIKLKHPERKFKEGASVKARVFLVDPENHRVSLTLKKTLVESDLPTPTRLQDISVGDLLHGVVSRHLQNGVLVDYFGNLRGFIPKKELSEIAVADIETAVALGQVVKTRVMNVDAEEKRFVASIRQATTDFKIPISVDTVNLGDILEGKVAAVHKDNIVVSLPSGVTALMSIQNLANHRGQNVSEIRSSVQMDDLLPDVVVVSKNAEKNLVIVANRPKSKPKDPSSPEKSANIDNIEVERIIPGRIVAHKPFGSAIRLGPHLFGRLCPTDTSDDFASQREGENQPAVDSTVTVAVVSIDKEHRLVHVSTRPSRLSPDESHSTEVVDREIASLKDLKVGDIVRGYVKNVAANGLYVTVGREIDARVLIKELFDEFVKDWQPRFMANQVVKGRITSVDKERKQVEMSFRSKDKVDAAQSHLTLQDFKKGQKVDGRVKSVQEIGLFIEVVGTKVSGLCHKSELSDNKKADVTQALSSFQPNDHVRAMVLSVDLNKKRISFGLKPSYFDGDDVEMGDEDAEPSKLGVEAMEGLNIERGSSAEEEQDDDGEDEDESEEDAMDSDDGEDDNDEVMMEVNSAPPVVKAAKALPSSNKSPALKLQGGFRWSLKDDEHSEASGSDSSSDDDGEPGDGESRAKAKKKKKKKTIQQDLTMDMHTKAPESSAGFERLLRTSPNSSYLWIQFMSFQLQLSEIDKAREIGRRALQVINFREEQEKLNVWLALLNLEVTFGTDDMLEEVFKEAARANDSKTIHLRLASILEEAGKQEKAEEMYRRTTKKFGQSSKAWSIFGEYYLKHNKLEEARQLLPRSLQSLEKRKHLKTISKFAQLEYHFGAAERGKTIFEGIVDSHPKRYDLWSIYIDMEAKQGDVSSLRNIFERVLAQKLSSKKAKFFFKKWLELEKKIGNEEGQDAVKQKAVEWMQQNTQAAVA